MIDTHENCPITFNCWGRKKNLILTNSLLIKAEVSGSYRSVRINKKQYRNQFKKYASSLLAKSLMAPLRYQVSKLSDLSTRKYVCSGWFIKTMTKYQLIYWLIDWLIIDCLIDWRVKWKLWTNYMFTYQLILCAVSSLSWQKVITSACIKARNSDDISDCWGGIPFCRGWLLTPKICSSAPRAKRQGVGVEKGNGIGPLC